MVMARCNKLVDAGRRQFLRGASLAVAGSSASAIVKPSQAATAMARIEYPINRLAHISELQDNSPLDVSYPDEDAPGVLIKLGTAVEGGVGPDSDIVGFSVICPHKGYPLSYNADYRTLNCPGHYSVFDCEAGGQQTWGHATQNLPQYRLSVDSEGSIFAEAIDELLYGRLSNVL